MFEYKNKHKPTNFSLTFMGFSILQGCKGAHCLNPEDILGSVNGGIRRAVGSLA